MSLENLSTLDPPPSKPGIVSNLYSKLFKTWPQPNCPVSPLVSVYNNIGAWTAPAQTQPYFLHCPQQLGHWPFSSVQAIPSASSTHFFSFFSFPTQQENPIPSMKWLFQIFPSLSPTMLAIWAQIGILLSPDLFLSFGVSYNISPALMRSTRCPRNSGVWVYDVILVHSGSIRPAVSRRVAWWMDFSAAFLWGYHVRWCWHADFIRLSSKTQEEFRTLGYLLPLQPLAWAMCVSHVLTLIHICSDWPQC